MNRFTLPALLLLPLALLGCSSTTATGPSVAVMTREIQQSMTPDQAIDRLKQGNARFVSGRSLHRDYAAEAKATAPGQYPCAAVVACIDSRTAPEVVFDQGIGDLFVPRVAGNYAPADILGSLEFATKISGAKAIVVVGHTNCGAVKGACDGVQLGNLTTVIDAIKPAVAATPGFEGDRTSKNLAFVDAVAAENVRLTMRTMRQNSPILRELEAEGAIRIVGAMQDLETGQVTFLN